MGELVTSLFGVLEAGLKLWATNDADSVAKKMAALKETYYAEYNKGPDLCSDAVLDNVVSELRILADEFAARIRAENTPARS